MSDMYVIVNPRTAAQHLKVFMTLRSAVERRAEAIETHGITTDFQIYKLVKVKTERQEV